MAAKLVRSWRGRTRGNLRELARTLDALLSYNVLHPTLTFLTLAQVTAWSQVATDAAGLLGAKRLR